MCFNSLRRKLLHLLQQKILYLLYDTLNWATPGIDKTIKQLPSIIWNFYYDATQLVEADNYVITTSNYMAW